MTMKELRPRLRAGGTGRGGLTVDDSFADEDGRVSKWGERDSYVPRRRAACEMAHFDG